MQRLEARAGRGGIVGVNIGANKDSGDRLADYAACTATLAPLVDFVTVDVSFISSTLILPVLPPMLKNEAEALVLVKPQFEVGRDQVGKGGIVRDTRLHREAITKVSHTLLALGFNGLASVASDLPGASGNREFFLRAVWRKSVLD